MEEFISQTITNDTRLVFCHVIEFLMACEKHTGMDKLNATKYMHLHEVVRQRGLYETKQMVDIRLLIAAMLPTTDHRRMILFDILNRFFYFQVKLFLK